MDLPVIRQQLAALHATATAIVQQTACILASLPTDPPPPPQHKRVPGASDLPANLND